MAVRCFFLLPLVELAFFLPLVDLAGEAARLVPFVFVLALALGLRLLLALFALPFVDELFAGLRLRLGLGVIDGERLRFFADAVFAPVFFPLALAAPVRFPFAEVVLSAVPVFFFSTRGTEALRL